MPCGVGRCQWAPVTLTESLPRLRRLGGPVAHLTEEEEETEGTAVSKVHGACGGASWDPRPTLSCPAGPVSPPREALQACPVPFSKGQGLPCPSAKHGCPLTQCCTCEQTLSDPQLRHTRVLNTYPVPGAVLTPGAHCFPGAPAPGRGPQGASPSRRGRRRKHGAQHAVRNPWKPQRQRRP